MSAETFVSLFISNDMDNELRASALDKNMSKDELIVAYLRNELAREQSEVGGSFLVHKSLPAPMPPVTSSTNDTKSRRPQRKAAKMR